MLLGLLGLCLLTGAAAGTLTAGNIATWYRTLARPVGAPPDWLFAPVWTALYLAMGCSAWLVWRHGARGSANRPRVHDANTPRVHDANTPRVHDANTPRVDDANTPRVDDANTPRVYDALMLWGWQLAVNAIWPAVFFGLHLPGLGLAVILVLLMLIVLTIRSFARIDRAAAALLLPYLAWCGYATYLNAGFWWLNRG